MLCRDFGITFEDVKGRNCVWKAIEIKHKEVFGPQLGSRVTSRVREDSMSVATRWWREHLRHCAARRAGR